MSKKKPVVKVKPPKKVEEVEEYQYADELPEDENEQFDEFEDDLGFDDDSEGPYDQDSLSFDKDARWELEEDESIKQIMRQISNKVNKRGQKDIYCWFKVQFLKTFALSNLDDKIINATVMDASNSFNREALMKMSDWDLKSYDYPTLSFWIRETIHVHLRRSYKDGERKHRTSRFGGMNDQTDYGEHTKSEFSLGDINPFKRKESKQPEAPSAEMGRDTEFI